MNIEEQEFVEEFKKCKIKALDISYLGTSLSKGPHEARLALKHILLDDKTHELNEEDKYLYVSSKKGGRELLKLVEKSDTIHILIKFALSYYGLLNKSFSFMEKDLKSYHQKKVLSLKDDLFIEFIAFMAFNDLFNAYLYLNMKNDIALRLLDCLIDYRYKNDMQSDLDAFDGNVTSLEENSKKKYLKQFGDIDDYFEDIKKDINNLN